MFLPVRLSNSYSSTSKPKLRMTAILSMPERRSLWVARIGDGSEPFSDESTALLESLRREIDDDGTEALLHHLRLCGAVPEQYSRSSSQEKLYSKYTDAVVSEALGAMGLTSVVLDARADAADVQARAKDYSLVADAKAFRLSRTAKNQKDFKVQSMDSWRSGLDYAVIVGPIYQFLSGNSQIYQQAIARNVCLLSFSHLACLVSLSDQQGKAIAESSLHQLLSIVALLHPGKKAADYWMAINAALVDSLPRGAGLWETEKKQSLVGLNIAKEESVRYLRVERDRLLRLSRQEAIEELVKGSKIDANIQRVESLAFGSLLDH